MTRCYIDGVKIEATLKMKLRKVCTKHRKTERKGIRGNKFLFNTQIHGAAFVVTRDIFLNRHSLFEHLHHT